MSSPVLLTTPPTLDADPLIADQCAKRHLALPSFGVIIPNPGPYAGSDSPSTSESTTPTSAINESECNAYDASRTNHALVNARQWTGAPIRAIVPLPRRKLVLPNAAHDAAHNVAHMNVPAGNAAVGIPPCLTRSTFLRDDVDTDFSGPEIEEEDEEEEDEEDEGLSGLRYCSYESITAAEGLSAWSFEELRVECYAQSLVARGTKPPPVVRPSLAIPPAFVPRVVPRS